MIICSVSQLGKVYSGNWLFKNVNLDIHQNDRIGIIGENGAGKTTLFNILSGNEMQDNGEIFLKKGIQVGYVKQIPNHSIQTVIDLLQSPFIELVRIRSKIQEIEELFASDRTFNSEALLKEYGELLAEYERKGGYQIKVSISKVASGLNIDKEMMNKPLSILSSAEQMKVGLAIALLKQPELLLLDEPTNHLDFSSIEWLEDFIGKYDGAVIIISHDGVFLDRTVHKIMEVEDGKLSLYHGNYSYFAEEKNRTLLNTFKNYKDQQKEITGMKRSIAWLHERGFFSRAKNMEHALNKIELINKPILERPKMKLMIDYDIDQYGENILKIRNVYKSYENKGILKNINLHITYSEKVAIIGGNGVGKSTLLKILADEVIPDKGTRIQHNSVKIGYLAQDIKFDTNKTLLAAFRDEIAVDEVEAASILKQFLFDGELLHRNLTNLSGGERVRFQLATALTKRVNLLILDEPTNHLDMKSKEIVRKALADFKGTIIAIVHDRQILAEVFNRVYLLENGKLIEM